MSSLFKRLVKGNRKSWSEPTFWEREARFPILASSAVSGNRESIENDFEGYIQGAYKTSGVVFACMLARQLAFSEARFAVSRYDEDGRPGELRFPEKLALLEEPWPGGTTGDLLMRMEADVSMAGNFYATVVDDRGRVGRAAMGGPGARVVRLRPDWVTIIIGSRNDPEDAHPYDVTARVVAYEYNPPHSGTYSPFGAPIEEDRRLLLLPEDVCHYSPIPDPAMRYRGMSWLTPIINEITADKAATKHKLKFFENGATPKTAVSLDKDISPELFQEFVEMFREQHAGVDNAYKTLFLAGGASVTSVGTDLGQMSFKVTQGAGETRIAAASGVPPIIVGLSEGLESATYSNYGQARRRFADMTIRPLWRIAAASLEKLVSLKKTEHLRVDDRDIAFLREDKLDQAEILTRQAEQIRQLVDGGFDPDSVVAAVTKGDFTELRGEHTGLLSVQLLPPGMGTFDTAANELVPPDPAMNPGMQTPKPGDVPGEGYTQRDPASGMAGGAPSRSQQSVSLPKPKLPTTRGARSRYASYSGDVEGKRDFSAEERRRLAERGYALPDGSYPIENEEDLRNAIRLAGHGDAGKEKIRAHIMRRARALGLSHLIPDEWTNSGGSDDGD